MKVHHLLNEGILDKIKAALGTVKGKVVDSMESLLKAYRKSTGTELTTIEKFKVVDFGEYLARVDTGALTCAIHATDIEVDEEAKKVKFKHEGKSYDMPLLRMKTAKNANGTVNRPRVELDYVWNKKTYPKMETSLADRKDMKFKLLVGRNLIKALKLPVRISDDETFE